MCSDNFCKHCQKYVQLDLMNDNTKYNTSIGYEPSQIFYVEVPFEISNHQLGSNL